MSETPPAGPERDPTAPRPAVDGPIRMHSTDARQASKEGVVRYVLTISLGVSVIGMVIAWFIVHGT